jgi:hypothetical protein
VCHGPFIISVCYSVTLKSYVTTAFQFSFKIPLLGSPRKSVGLGIKWNTSDSGDGDGDDINLLGGKHK